MANEVEVIRHLEKHNDLGGFSVGEIAEALGMFPSDVEKTLKDLSANGQVKCYVYNGQLYAVFERLEPIIEYPKSDNGIMYS